MASHGINGGQMEFFHNNWWYISIVELKSTSSGNNSHQGPRWTFLLSIRINKFLEEFMTNLQQFRPVQNTCDRITSAEINKNELQVVSASLRVQADNP